ncbi:MAG: hypothetical protein ACKOTZ_05020 [Chloroflexota bacterium]
MASLTLAARARHGRRRVAALIGAVARAGAGLALTVVPAAAADFLTNGGFETPGTYVASCNGSGGSSPWFETIEVGGDGKAIGWYTTDECLERWQDGFLGQGAYEGDFFAELNATCKGAIYQEFSVTAGQKILWQVAHSDRDGVETMRFYLGDASASSPSSARCTAQRLTQALTGLTPQVLLMRNGVLLNLDANDPAPSLLSDGANDRGLYFGTYTVPAGVSTVRFALSSDDAGSIGNFVDAVAIQSPSGELFVDKSAAVTEVAPTIGTVVDYTIDVTTDGQVIGPIEIEDPRADTLDCEAVTDVGDEDIVLEVGETVSCSATVILTRADIRRGKIRNTATATGDFGVTTGVGSATVKFAPTIAVLLDESGSIATSEGIWLRRYNRLVRDFQRLTSVAPYYRTRFNSEQFLRQWRGIAIENAPRLSPVEFRPDHYTDLYDAATRAIRNLVKQRPVGRVIFAIATDGEDNAGTSASRDSLARLIRARERAGWSFLFIGAGATDLQAAVAAVDAPVSDAAPEATEAPAAP